MFTLRLIIYFSVTVINILPVLCQNDQLKRQAAECDEPELVVQAHFNEYSDEILKKHNTFNLRYRSSLGILCTSENATKLAIKKNGEKLPVNMLSDTEIYWSTNGIEVQKSEYTCEDIETGCERSVFILVTPGLDVRSTDGNDVKLISAKHLTHVIQYGTHIEVICTGQNATNLSLTKDGKKIAVKKYSDTRIDWSYTPGLEISEYVCSDDVNKMNTTVIAQVEPRIYVRANNETLGRSDFDYDNDIHEFAVNSKEAEVLCTGPKPVKLIGLNNKGIIMENVNATTVKVSVRNPEVKELGSFSKKWHRNLSGGLS